VNLHGSMVKKSGIKEGMVFWREGICQNRVVERAVKCHSVSDGGSEGERRVYIVWRRGVLRSKNI